MNIERTWFDFIKTYDEGITEKEADYILMNETGYPFSDTRMTSYQLRSNIRAIKNGIKRCDMCGRKIPFHSNECFSK